jgi:metal-dependent HD superfamily phosphatase/phosphodiesterase
MKSPKEIALDKKILKLVQPYPKALEFAKALMEDEELQELQEYANIVSIRRLGFNDHGPVHMREVVVNALTMLELLCKAGIKTSLEENEVGSYEMSVCGVFAAAFMHDLGMSVGREGHEKLSCILAAPILDRILAEQFSVRERVIIKTLAIEGISGHMATQRIHSVEAGLILIADGCDMERGRARIPLAINTEPKVGDIHKYSANSILCVSISEGEEKPIKIDVNMEADVGFFQIEEVLIPKINSSPVRCHIELYAGVNGERKRYM